MRSCCPARSRVAWGVHGSCRVAPTLECLRKASHVAFRNDRLSSWSVPQRGSASEITCLCVVHCLTGSLRTGEAAVAVLAPELSLFVDLPSAATMRAAARCYAILQLLVLARVLAATSVDRDRSAINQDATCSALTQTNEVYPVEVGSPVLDLRWIVPPGNKDVDKVIAILALPFVLISDSVLHTSTYHSCLGMCMAGCAGPD